MEFRAGDMTLQIGGRAAQIRLTMGALAEIAAVCAAPGPAALAQFFRAAPRPSDMRQILAALLRPVYHAGAENMALTAEIDTAAPLIAQLFERSFSPTALDD